MKFLRRVPDRDHVLVKTVSPAYPSGIGVHKDAFKCGKKDQEGPPEKQGLSWTKMSTEMEFDKCRAYWDHCQTSEHPSYVKPALFWLRNEEVEAALGATLRFSRDEDDLVYGHLHHLTCCPDEDGRVLLAKKAQEAPDCRLLHPHVHPRRPQKPDGSIMEGARRNIRL